MEFNKCLGCMEDFRGYPCPNCRYDPVNAVEVGYALPLKAILFGKYLVGRVLGQGGFGITYVGWDLALERKVAIKEYYPSGQVSRVPGERTLTWYVSENARQAKQDGMEMFLKEARKMAKVDNIPGVVKVRDLFRENDTAYIVMDFVEGETLKARLKRNGPLSWDQAKEIFLPAIHSMERVHQAGLVHRDLSPDNLMLTPDGQVMVLDLGAAKDLNINSGASSMQVAKSGFSPLEQYTQRGGSGPWTDVYAMAATVYYSLTGTLPPNAVDRVEEDTLSFAHPGLAPLPEQAKEALKNALALSAKNRTQTMAELEEGLFGEEKPVPEPKPEPQPESELKPEEISASKPEPKPEPKTEPAPVSMSASSKLLIVAAVIAMCAMIGYYTVVVKTDRGWEQPVTVATEPVTVAIEPVTIAAGDYHTVRLRSDGTVAAVGDNTNGQCGVSNWRDIVAVSAGGYHTAGLRSDGTVVAVGLDDNRRCEVSNWRDIVAVSAGGYHTVGLRSDGRVVAVGGMTTANAM